MNFNNLFLSSIFSIAPVGFLVFDSNMKIIEANDYLFNCLNIDRKNIKGNSFGNVYNCEVAFSQNKVCGEAPECMVCQIRNSVKSVLKNNDVISNVEISNILKTGRAYVKKWFKASFGPLELEGKKYVAFTFVDITEFKKYENEIKENKNRYKAIFDNMTKAFALHEIITDKEGNPVDYRFLEVNKAFENLTNLRADGILGKTVKEVLPKTEQYWIDTYGKVALTGAPYFFEDYSQELGKYYDVWVFCPSIGQFATVFSDITSRKTAEEELIKSEKKFKRYINQSPDGVFIVEKKGIIKEVNTAACNITGYENDELLGKNAFELIPEESQADLLKAFEEMDEKGSFSMTLKFVRKDLEKRICSIDAVKIASKEYIAFIKDITESKRIEEKLEYSYSHDELTGLYSRKYFDEKLPEFDIEANLPISIVIADINGLKVINDAFGWQVGDKVIQKAAAVIKKESRGCDIIARWSADRFIAIMPKCDLCKAEKVVQNIKEHYAKENIDSVSLSASFGASEKRNSDERIDALIKAAEDDMLKNKAYESASTRGKTINMILSTLHEKSRREEMHSKRVSEICMSIGKALGLSEADITKLKVIGLVHDIGKIGINERILNKQGKLTERERSEIFRHPEIGYRILSSSNTTSELAEHMLAHHERIDGKGYPNGICGNEISRMTRILSIADSYDAMTSKRSYRNPMPKELAIKELTDNSNTQFDPEIVKVFINKVLNSDIGFDNLEV